MLCISSLQAQCESFLTFFKSNFFRCFMFLGEIRNLWMLLIKVKVGKKNPLLILVCHLALWLPLLTSSSPYQYGFFFFFFIKSRPKFSQKDIQQDFFFLIKHLGRQSKTISTTNITREFQETKLTVESESIPETHLRAKQYLCNNKVRLG